MPYKAKFSMIYINKLKDDSVRDIYSVAPDIMPFRMKFFRSILISKWFSAIIQKPFCPSKVLGVFQSGDNCNQALVFYKAKNQTGFSIRDGWNGLFLKRSVFFAAFF